MKKSLLHSLFSVACSLCGATQSSEAAPATERPFVHPLFSDHLVLPRERAGQPEVPFRTDEWSGITQGRH